ncbi:MAG: IclR family transcriptional regulator [Pseudomonadota bacterium]
MTKKSSSIQVIDRMAKLLDAISRYDDSASLKFLSADTDLHPATAHRILASLIEQGFVERNETGYYRLGYKLMELGCGVNSRLDVKEEALEILQNLRDELGETANLTIRKGDQVVYVERAIANRIMRVEQVIGSHAPLHVTAVGKLMLANEGEKSIDAYVKRTGLPGFTKNTLTKIEPFKAELKTAFKQGYTFDNEEAEIGVGCIGVLVRNSSGKIVAGLSVSAPIERRQDDWIPIVVEAADKLSTRLGYRKK